VQNNDVCAKTQSVSHICKSEYVSVRAREERTLSVYECIYILLLLQRCYVNDIVRRVREREAAALGLAVYAARLALTFRPFIYSPRRNLTAMYCYRNFSRGTAAAFNSFLN
jgi:hypothetical protein